MNEVQRMVTSWSPEKQRRALKLLKQLRGRGRRVRRPKPQPTPPRKESASMIRRATFLLLMAVLLVVPFGCVQASAAIKTTDGTIVDFGVARFATQTGLESATLKAPNGWELTIGGYNSDPQTQLFLEMFRSLRTASPVIVQTPESRFVPREQPPNTTPNIEPNENVPTPPTARPGREHTESAKYTRMLVLLRE